MRSGLFGKLPAKRDFVALAAPREFLSPWETWLQGGVSASRQQLGQDWQAVFLRAPLWRFWLGADVCGRAVLGVFMPSVDGVGRYFPLTVFVCADHGETIAPPELAGHEPWFEAAEALLLDALTPEAAYEAVVARVQALPEPGSRANSSGQGPNRLGDGTFIGAVPADGLAAFCAAVRVADPALAYSAATFWWTIGGDDFPPVALARRGMPNPYLLTGMLSGDFSG
jgi:type VI secretion system protein ImpM